jgi:hypothetical protein
MSTTFKRARGARLAMRAISLRQQHPALPAIRILDQVFARHRGRLLEFDDPAVPGGDCLVEPMGNPFAPLLIEAFDPTSSPEQWATEAAKVEGNLAAEIACRDRWTVLVVEPFLRRYGLDA